MPNNFYNTLLCLRDFLIMREIYMKIIENLALSIYRIENWMQIQKKLQIQKHIQKNKEYV